MSKSIYDDSSNILDHSDHNMELLLCLLLPNINAPIIQVSNEKVGIRISHGATAERKITINNIGRGVLSGKIELALPIAGIELSVSSFSINSKNNDEVTLTVKVNRNKKMRAATYRNEIIVTSNASKNRLIIPLRLNISEPLKQRTYRFLGYNSEDDHVIPDSVKESRRQKLIASILSIVVFVSVSLIAFLGLSNFFEKYQNIVMPVDNITLLETSRDKTGNHESGSVNEVSINHRSLIAAGRSINFSQIIARVSYASFISEDNGANDWGLFESAGQITVARPYGESVEAKTNKEKVEFEFYPNDDSAIWEWNELAIGSKRPSGAIWLESDSSGGFMTIDYFNINGEVINRHEGEMVMVEWVGSDGISRYALEFAVNVTGMIRPAAFEIFQIIYDHDTDKAVSIEYPYYVGKVTIIPPPGSRITLKTGPTNIFGPEGDQGYGFYMWN